MPDLSRKFHGHSRRCRAVAALLTRAVSRSRTNGNPINSQWWRTAGHSTIPALPWPVSRLQFPRCQCCKRTRAGNGIRLADLPSANRMPANFPQLAQAECDRLPPAKSARYAASPTRRRLVTQHLIEQSFRPTPYVPSGTTMLNIRSGARRRLIVSATAVRSRPVKICRC